MAAPFSFTEPKIKALPTPPGGRVYYRDSTSPGLQCCVTSAGTKTYYYVKRLEGKPTRVKLGTTEELSVKAARTAAATHAGKVAEGKNPQAERRERRKQPTLQQLFDHWLIYANGHKKASSAKGDEWLWERYLKKPWSTRKIGSIKKVDVQAHHAKIGRENGIYAANRMLALLRAMYNKADDIGYRGDNPAAKITKFKEVARDRFLQENELKAFFDALAKESDLFQDFFILALLTGARRGNLQSMAWSELDLDRAVWRIPDTKGNVPLIVPLVEPAVKILRRRVLASKSPWVFPAVRNGTHLKEPKGAWKRICTAAGLSDLRPHDLRRSLGSYMAIGGTSLPIIGKTLGHAEPRTTQIYARLTVGSVREAVTKATTAMLTAGGQERLLTIDVREDKNDE